MSRSHVAQATSAHAHVARRDDLTERRELEHSREVLGAMLTSAREACGASGRAVSLALGVNEASLRRWEAGEVSAPLDALVRLPASVALKVGQLLVAHARGRLLTSLPIVDARLAVAEGYARYVLAQSRGRDAERFALADLRSVVEEAEGRLAQ